MSWNLKAGGGSFYKGTQSGKNIGSGYKAGEKRKKVGIMA